MSFLRSLPQRNQRKLFGDYRASFNVSPTQNVPAARVIDGELQAQMLRWGLVPFWAKGVAPKYSTINATIEKIETAPTWRGPWQRGQRCLLPARGFYEWQVLPDGKSKQPFYIHCADQETFAFAGLWDSSQSADGTAVESCTIITLPASPLMATIHNSKQRMPAILSLTDCEAWLAGAANEAFATLKPYPDDLLVAWPVSTRVNSPRNHGPELIQPA